MVKLERMVLQNFKSFSGKTTIPFPSGFVVIAGPNGSGKCIEYNSLVTLADGRQIKIGNLVDRKLKDSKNVERLEDGMYTTENKEKLELLSMNRELKIVPKKIKAFVKRGAPEKLLSIKTRTGKEIITTDYHPFFGIGAGGIFSLEAKGLKKGVKIAMPRIISVSPKPQSVDISSVKDLYIPYSLEIENEVRNAIKESGLTQKIFAAKCGIPLNAVKGLFDKQSIRANYLIKILSNNGHNQDVIRRFIETVKFKNTAKKVNISYKLTPDLARFLGYLTSEGRSTNSNQIWFVNEDENMINDFIDITKNEFNLDAKVFNYKTNAKDVIIFSKPLQTYLENAFDVKMGSKSNEKTVPEILFSSSEETVSNFLSGLFDGDGYLHCDYHGKKTHVYFEYSTASLELARGIQTLLIRIGVMSFLKEKIKYASNTKSKKKRKYYSLLVYGEHFRSLVNKIVFRNKQKEKIANKIKNMETTVNPNVDLIPNPNTLIRQLVKETKISIKKNRKICPKLQAYYETRCDCSRKGIGEIVEIIEKHGTINDTAKAIINQLKLLSDSDIFWDEIIEIKEIEPKNKYVYDLTIDETHNFVANNFFVHNSNIVDALTFVLGTSSARSIRAQKLQNLIFNGAAKNKPAEFCEVDLYLDNKDKKIPVEEEEIKIARRITRSGISVYKLNGRTVNKSKVLDFLANANLSPDGFNIIMQGDVTRIIELSPKERREIIDEISGIAEFNQKKELAMSKLEKVETRVREAMIIISEKQKRVTQLKADKENAEKYIKLETELKKARASLINRRLHEAKKEIENANIVIKDYSKQLEELDKEAKKSDIELEKKESMIKSKGDEIIEKRDFETVRSIERIRSEILRRRDQVGFRDTEIERLSRSVRDLTTKIPYPTTIFSSIVKVPEEYSIAIEVAVGSHARDLVVENDEIAAKCVKYMKEKHIRRARFLPLNKIRGRALRDIPKKAKLALDLVDYDKKFAPAVEYVLGNTIVVENIDVAREILNKHAERFRIATLDGDLIEASGAVIGGYYKKTKKFDLERLKAERRNLVDEIEHMEEEMEKVREREEKEKSLVSNLQKERSELENEVISFRKKRKELVEQKFVLQSRISKLQVDKAKAETQLEDLKKQSDEFRDIKEYFDLPPEKLQEKVSDCLYEIRKIGPVNMKAIEEYDILAVEFEELKKKLDKLLEEKGSIVKTITEVEKKRTEKFAATLTEIRGHFSRIYKDLTGGYGTIRLEEENNIDSGLVIEANPEGKKVVDLDVMSGGEKTLTSLAFLFAIMQHYSSPFYILDEVDAALDKANTRKITNLVKKYSKSVQFIIISHNDITTSAADKVFGCSMEEGVSKIFGIDMPKR